jgi:NAD(P)H-dependent FMN reductase
MEEIPRNEEQQDEQKVRLGLIYGSTRDRRFCDTVAQWVTAQIVSDERFSVEIVDPARMDGERPLKEQIGEADAFVVVTPEYNHGYPAPLKALIDSVGAEWHAKPVAFVSYGGISGGLRAVEQLRQVFAELHAVTVRDTVSFASAWEQFDARGGIVEPDRPRRSMATMLGRLHWWAVALRSARKVTPFTRAA